MYYVFVCCCVKHPHLISFSLRLSSDTDNDWNEVCSLCCFIISRSCLSPQPYLSYHILIVLYILQCEGYDITSPTDGIRSLWRQRFAEASSPFNSFNRNFASGSKPSIARRNTTPEIFYFTHNQVGVFGLNQPGGPSFEEGDGPVGDDLNAEWVADQLADDTTCSLKSIVLVAHKTPSSDVNDALDAYFATCGSILPTLTITGSSHPSTYCFNFDAGIVKRVDVTMEAFRSGPLRVSVNRDPNGEDYFHVSDADLADSNSNCPNFSSP